ncbi:hypothetical protein [Streptomyces sp. NRRL S-350]|uniref:hypothetical protein n=1 Tax=Streptomyces sp. NRRL S-350 TaxID=1463902 RepID=UPI00131B229A|nr:hypothetical protein [Streptomyces sp. NRRL S-350]
MKRAMERLAGAVALTFASALTMTATALPAHAVDTYSCGASVPLTTGARVAVCLHFGGSPGWSQPLIQITGGGTILNDSTQMWLNSGDGHYNDYSYPTPGYYGEGKIWGKSTDWRIGCYVQAQAYIGVPGAVYGVYSPTMNVC